MVKGDARHEVETDQVHGFEPSYSTFETIRHYHGDAARDLMIGAAALALIASPIYAGALHQQFPFIIAGVLAVAFAAGLTNPKRPLSATADAVVSGAGMAIYAGWGLLEYQTTDLLSFIFRMFIAVLFLFAFYFSMKTVRAFSLGEVGAKERYGEIDTDRHE